MSEVMHRHWKTLQLVPRHPRKASAKQIWQALEGQGYSTSERTVQRDLKELSGVFPLTCDETDKPFGWKWAKNADLINIPAMDLASALTFRFVREYVDPLLPASVRSDLSAHFDAAEKVLNAFQSAKLPSWSEKIVVIPQGQALRAPEIAGGVAETVFEALLTDQQMRVVYRKRTATGEEPPQERLVHPLGIVLRNQVYYLVATLFDYTNEVQLALHRMDSAELLHEPANRPNNFNLKTYVAKGNFAYPVGDWIQLKVLFDRAIAVHLGESPLSEDQKIHPLGEQTVRLTATVQDTQQLRWWLLAFGNQVVVEAPTALRNEFRQIAKSLAERYA
jgi:predicted DNA-binding transcriptional regulator YafY